MVRVDHVLFDDGIISRFNFNALVLIGMAKYVASRSLCATPSLFSMRQLETSLIIS